MAITCPQVVGIYKDVEDSSLEYRRKMRTVIRGITAVARHPEVLNPFRMGLFAFQVWSHKIMRWFIPTTVHDDPYFIRNKLDQKQLTPLAISIVQTKIFVNKLEGKCRRKDN